MIEDSLCRYLRLGRVYIRSGVAWVICARGGLQMCRPILWSPSSREMPDSSLISPVFAAPSWLLLGAVPLATPLFTRINVREVSFVCALLVFIRSAVVLNLLISSQ